MDAEQVLTGTRPTSLLHRHRHKQGRRLAYKGFIGKANPMSKKVAHGKASQGSPATQATQADLQERWAMVKKAA